MKLILISLFFTLCILLCLIIICVFIMEYPLISSATLLFSFTFLCIYSLLKIKNKQK